MSEANIDRWQETITPRDTSKPWVLGPGGSFDAQNVQPIPDSMLAELAKLYASHGCPWNCRSLPLSPSDREYMYLLYYSMQGLVARMRLAERQASALRDALETVERQCSDRLTEASGNTALLPHIRELLAEPARDGVRRDALFSTLGVAPHSTASDGGVSNE